MVCWVMIVLTPADATICVNSAGLTLAGLPSVLAICLNSAGLPSAGLPSPSRFTTPAGSYRGVYPRH